MRLTKDLKALQDQIEQQIYDTRALRRLDSYIIKTFQLHELSENLGHSIIYCDICGLLSFAAQTSVAYNGEYWVCQDCMKKFSFCKRCNTNVLVSDLSNPHHAHSEVEGAGKLIFPKDIPVAAFNADIMSIAGQNPSYFKTFAEQQVLSHRVSNFSSDPERVFRYFGLELEVEKVPGAPPDLNLRTLNALGEKFAMLKHDGSLSRRGKGGFEIVTMPATLAYHKGGVWSSFFQQLGPFFLSHPPTTGLHIHIGRNTLSPLTVGKLLLFVNSEDNREFIYGIANRNLRKPNPNGRLYAGVRTWKASDLLRLKQHLPSCPWHPNNKAVYNFYATINGTIKTDPWGNPIIDNLDGKPTTVRKMCRCPEGQYGIDHYEAVNLQTHRPTIELRIFRGIINESFLYACLEFADSLVDFCNETSPNELSYKSYLDFVVKRGRRCSNLRQLLINQCWIDSSAKPSSEVPYGIYA